MSEQDYDYVLQFLALLGLGPNFLYKPNKNGLDRNWSVIFISFN